MDHLPKDMHILIIEKLYQDPTVPQSDINTLKLISKKYDQIVKDVEKKNKYQKKKKELLEKFKKEINKKDIQIKDFTQSLEKFISNIESKIHRRKVAFDTISSNDLIIEWNKPNIGEDFIASGDSRDKILIIKKNRIDSSSDPEIKELLDKTNILDIFSKITSHL